jgi:hypothetical protein
MSQLETESQRFLQPLLIGERIGLDTTGQATLARWGLKTAMVLEALDRSQEPAYTSAEREQLRIGGAIPSRTSVWLAASADPSWFMSTSNRHLGADKEQDIGGVSVTMGFAHVVLQVLTIKVPLDVGPTTRRQEPVGRRFWA